MRNNSMFHRPMRLLAAGSLLFAALLAAQPAVAQLIGGSKHDLTATGNGGAFQTTTTEICVFCHTPHGASPLAPLWNRVAPATATFQVYASTTMNGTVSQPGSNSALCLSCHDGATALDNILNKPGRGAGTAGSAGYAFGATATAANFMLSTAVGNLGADLRNDHPISMPYCGGLSGAGCLDPDFHTNVAGNVRLMLGGVAQTGPAAVDGNWWVESGPTMNTTREKKDLPLYYANSAPAVQCGSCHEPHSGTAAGGAGTAVSFLRIANTGSQLCLSCHNK